MAFSSSTNSNPQTLQNQAYMQAAWDVLVCGFTSPRKLKLAVFIRDYKIFVRVQDLGTR